MKYIEYNSLKSLKIVALIIFGDFGKFAMRFLQGFTQGRENSGRFA
jgi:hypothetical protein